MSAIYKKKADTQITEIGHYFVIIVGIAKILFVVLLNPISK
tara:strand:- start:132 stop:254 length:123 start_codon:yes stop_codon:yes gene_type:complete